MSSIGSVTRDIQGAVAFLVAWVKREPGEALLTVAGAFLFLLLLLVLVLIRVAVLLRQQKKLLGAVSGGDVERMIEEHANLSVALQNAVARAGETSEANAHALRSCFQRVGLVRYDALPQTGGEQSFSLALLDAENNGIVLTGLHNRHDMRVYAKPVTGGASAWSLSDEERRAIDSARPGAIEPMGAPKSRIYAPRMTKPR